MIRSGFRAVFMDSFLAPLVVSSAWLAVPVTALAQGQALQPIKVNLPPSPNFDAAAGPLQHPTGELTVYGLRKGMSRHLDKDVRLKGVVLEVYECPEALRKCNEAAGKASKAAAKPPRKGAPPPPQAALAGGCRPCDQPHFFVGDSATTKMSRALLIADYPVKDWDTGKPRPLAAKVGDAVVVTGTFAINSATGFAASNGLLVHKRTVDASGKILAEGNAVLPPEAQTIQLEGQPPEPLKLGKK